MSSSRNVMRWTPEVHEDILIGLCSAVKLSTSQWNDLMEFLHGRQYHFTESALKCVCLCMHVMQLHFLPVNPYLAAPSRPFLIESDLLAFLAPGDLPS